MTRTESHGHTAQPVPLPPAGGFGGRFRTFERTNEAAPPGREVLDVAGIVAAWSAPHPAHSWLALVTHFRADVRPALAQLYSACRQRWPGGRPFLSVCWPGEAEGHPAAGPQDARPTLHLSNHPPRIASHTRSVRIASPPARGCPEASSTPPEDDDRITS